MRLIIKRLSLGLFLIAATSSVLLVSDLKSRRGARERAASAPESAQKVFRLALLQHASQPVLDDGARGLFDGLRDKGYAEGDNFTVKRFNAEGDMPVANAIAKDITDGKYDLVLSISTPSMQAVANANKANHIPHVFGLVSDPYAAGVGISRENHLDHPPYMAGHGTMQPVDACFRLARQLYPALKTVGVVWNPSEANSEAQLKVARQTCAELGIRLLETTVDNSAGVLDAANAVVSRGSEALWVGGDITVLTAFQSTIQAAKKGRIPLFTVIPPHAERGALFDLGANYYEVGKIMGELAAEILGGRDPATVPIDNVVPEILVVNKLALTDLKDPWRLPPEILQRANIVFDETGKHQKDLPAPAGASAGQSRAGIARPPPGKIFRIAMAYFAPEQAIDSCMKGLLDGLVELGFQEGKNLVISKTHAQGEMINIPALMQNADSGDADLVVTFTTPLLQGACFGLKKKPVVFTCVTDPIAAGAGKSWTDHYAHVTGVGSFPPLEETMELIPRLVPGIKSLGTLYNSGEANSVKIISVLRELVPKKGIQLVELTAANTGEMMQAAQGLVARQIQAIYLPSDNTVYQALEGILKVAANARMPVINDDAEHLPRGMLASIGAGYYESGKATAPYVARVLLGEKPADLPMTNVSVNVTKLNHESAKRLGLSFSPGLVQELETKSKRAPILPSKSAAPLAKKWKIHVIELNDVPAQEESRKGVLAGIVEAGLVLGRDYEIRTLNAQGDTATLNALIDAAVGDRADMLVVISTLALQSAIKKVRDLPIVFAQVTDPIKAGAGRSLTDHLPNVTGSTPLSDHRKMVSVIRKCLPAAERIGTLFNPSEDNSVIQKDGLISAAQQAGIQVETIGINQTPEIANAATALSSRRLDAICQISDNLTSAGFASIVNAARQARIPLFCYQTAQAQDGAVVAVARDFFDAGKVAGNLAARIARGGNPAKLPFELVDRTRLIVNLKAAQGLGLKLPADLIRDADGVIDDKGYKEKTQAKVTASKTPPSKSVAPLSKKWRVQMVNYNESGAAEEVMHGIDVGLKGSGLVLGRDYTLKYRSAQGDIATLNSIFDAAMSEGADLFLVLSTPTLQVAMKKVRETPVVFAFVANPMIAGAGRSYTDHLPLVTGISSLSPFGEMCGLLQKHFPQYRRVGTLFCPAEINSVHNKDMFVREAAERGITVETVPVNTASDLPEGAAALCSRKIDAIVQISDNLTAAGFVSIGRAAQRAGLPLLSFNSPTIKHGSAVVVSRDFYQGGFEAAEVAVRVMRGESPAKIPFSLIKKTRMIVHLPNSASLGMKIPPALLSAADEVIRQ